MRRKLGTTLNGLIGAVAMFGAMQAMPASAATIFNGSFESGLNPGVYTTVGTGSPAIKGWTVTAGSVDYIGSYWQAAEGSRSIDLAGSAIGAIEQTIDTLANVWYKLTFAISKNPDGGSATRTGTVSVDGVEHLLSYGLANDRTDMQWDLQTLIFQAQGPTTLRFAADGSSAGFYGLAIDNVSITAVPEPESWGMVILGLGAVGVIARRRKAAVQDRSA